MFLEIPHSAERRSDLCMFSSNRLLDLIKERRSVRLFNGEKVAREDVFSIIEAGIWAPTGCNNQELRFLILDKQEELEEILEFKPFFRGVSAVVLIFYDMSLPMSHKMYVKNRAERHLPYVDVGLALENMILYAKSRNIDSCIFNLSEYHFKIHRKEKSLVKRMVNLVKLKLGFHKSIEENLIFFLRTSLKIPEHFKILCGVAFGYAKNYPDVKTESHGDKKLMRESVDNYIINTERSVQ